MTELFYPTIDLFVYDLRSPLNADSAEITENLQSFQKRLPPGTQFHDIKTETEYLELTLPTTLKLEAVNASLAEVNFRAVRLNDTYGLQVDCSVNNLTEPQAIDSFSQIQTEIKPYSDFNSLLTIGQTWLISGWLTEDTQDPENIAKECYQILFPKNQWTQDLYGKDDFLQGTIWELWQSRSYPNDHIVIILFKDRATAEKAGSFYTDWMGFFCYRHKITWAYNNSRLIKEALVNHYKKVENNAITLKKNQNLKIDLTHLQEIFNEIQTVLNQYTVDLLKLSFQKEIIEINLVNYQTRLEFIKRKAGEDEAVSFFNKFSNLAEKKYLPQIVKDKDNMQLGLQLLESNINALRSQIELEKSERDRNFQNIITVVGSGTAIAAYLDFKDEKCQPILKGISVPESLAISSCKNFWVGSIFVPVLFLLMLGGFGLAIRKLIQKFN
jgi:hypothetical protein